MGWSAIRYSILAIILTSIFSCKKEEKCVAGSGGDLTFKIYLQHHEHTLINLKNYRDTVYVKYNVQEFPGGDSADYDATYFGEYNDDFVLLTNLKCGDYYLYAVGLEPQHFSRVSGGIPYSVQQKEGEIKLIIPVTE